MEKTPPTLRVARPQGTTSLALTSRAPSKTEEEVHSLQTKIRQRYIDEWISTGGYNNVTNRIVSIQELADTLQMTEEGIAEMMMGRFNGFANLFDPTQKAQVNQIASGAIFSGLKLGLESRHIALSQAQLLIGAQKGKYVPFLSKEANGAIANLIGANKGLTEIAKLLSDLASKSLGLPNEHDDPTAYLTPTEAIRIIGEQGRSMIEDTNLIEAKKAQLIGIPDINPMTQKTDLEPMLEIQRARDKNLPYTHEDILEAEDFQG